MPPESPVLPQALLCNWPSRRPRRDTLSGSTRLPVRGKPSGISSRLSSLHPPVPGSAPLSSRPRSSTHACPPSEATFMAYSAATTLLCGHGLRARPRELAHDQGAHHAGFFMAWLRAVELVCARRERGGPTRAGVGLRLDLDRRAIDHQVVNQGRATVVERDVHGCVGANG